MLCPHCSTSNISKALACRSCGASLHDAPKTVGPLHLLVGTKLQGGNFSIGKLVQQDDMGFTYMGSDSRVHRLVGVKELFPVGSSRREKAVIAAASALSAYNAAKRQFLQDAQTFLELRHPHLHRALAAFEEHNSVYFIVESTPGKSLAVLLQERGSPLNETEALTYIEKVGAALATAHGAGLLHSDLRPEHVLISADKQPILTNFQLGSKALHGLLNGHSTSSSTKLISRYAAPEHYTPGAQISASTDVYGLAAMLYHMLTGNPPIAATARAKGVALKAIKALNPQISATVAQSVMAALSLDALQRPQSITVFLQQLKAAPANHQKPTAGFTLAPVAPLPSHAPAVAPAPTLLPHDLLLRTTPAPSVTVTIIPPKQDAPLRATVSAFHPTSATVSKLTGHAGRVSSVAFSPVGNLLASAGEDGAVLIRDARGGALQRSLTEALPQTLVGVVSEARPRSLNDTLSLAQTVRHSVQSSLQGQVKRVSAVSFSPDGRTLACGNEDSVITLWNAQTGKLQRTLKEHFGRVTAVAFGPNGDVLASASSDGSAILWDVMQGKPLQAWTDHGAGVSSVAFSPDGRMLATGSQDNGVLLWDIHTRKILNALTAQEHEVTALAFSPDSRLIASGSYDKTVLLWDISDISMDRPLWTLTGHTGGVTSVTFSPDSHILASGSYDKTVRLWDALTGQPIITLSDHWGSVNSVAFAPDGKTLASGSLQEVWLWALS